VFNFHPQSLIGCSTGGGTTAPRSPLSPHPAARSPRMSDSSQFRGDSDVLAEIDVRANDGLFVPDGGFCDGFIADFSSLF
jgi:hypothetical protein